MYAFTCMRVCIHMYLPACACVYNMCVRMRVCEWCPRCRAAQVCACFVAVCVFWGCGVFVFWWFSQLLLITVVCVVARRAAMTARYTMYRFSCACAHTTAVQSEVWASMEGSDERKRLEIQFMKEMEEWKRATAAAASVWVHLCCVFIHKYVCMYTYTYICMYVCVCIYIYIYIYMQARGIYSLIICVFLYECDSPSYTKVSCKTSLERASGVSKAYIFIHTNIHVTNSEEFLCRGWLSCGFFYIKIKFFWAERGTWMPRLKNLLVIRKMKTSQSMRCVSVRVSAVSLFF